MLQQTISIVVIHPKHRIASSESEQIWMKSGDCKHIVEGWRQENYFKLLVPLRYLWNGLS